MNKKVIMIGMLGLLLFSSIAVSTQNETNDENNLIHRGTFQAEIGLREEVPAFELEGNFRDFRGRHALFGTISPVDSDRNGRFQGFFTRNLFIIQTGVRNNVLNIVGRFTEYDEDLDEYSGQWRGFVVGVGRTSGWITASFSS